MAREIDEKSGDAARDENALEKRLEFATEKTHTAELGLSAAATDASRAWHPTRGDRLARVARGGGRETRGRVRADPGAGRLSR